MEIRNYSSNQAFGVRFEPKALTEVVDYAAKTNQLNKLDSALNSLLHANKGDILIVHGKAPNGMIFSSFTMGKRAVQNLVYDCKSPAQASFNGILQLAEFGKKFKRLVGGEVKQEFNPSEIIARYSK